MTRPSASYLSGTRIAPPPITGRETAADLIENAFLAYNAGRLREGCRLFTDRMLAPEVAVGMSVTGALTPAGLGMSTIIPLMQAGFVVSPSATMAGRSPQLARLREQRQAVHAGQADVEDAEVHRLRPEQLERLLRALRLEDGVALVLQVPPQGEPEVLLVVHHEHDLARSVHGAASYPAPAPRAAAVIGRDPSPFLQYVIINRGSNDGIQRGMPVVTNQGLVGRVDAVIADAARVQLITDPASNVNVRLQNAEPDASLIGSVTGDVTLDLIPQDVALEPGQRL